MAGTSSNAEKLSLLQRFAFGTGHMLNVLAVAGMWFPYGIAFFTQVLEIPHASVGHIIISAQVAGAIFTPFLGIWSDQCVCKYGRRKIFHLVGILSFFFSFFFVWYDCIDCQGVEDRYKILYYSSFAIVFQFGWAAAQIAQLALIPEMTSDRNERVGLNSIRYGFQVAGTLLVFIIFLILLVKLNRSVNTAKLEPADKPVFWIMAIIVTVLGLILTLPFQIFIREKPSVSLRKLKWYKWLINPRFYLVMCVFVAARIITMFTLQYFPLYFLETLKMNEPSIAIGPLIFYITSVIVTIFVKMINKKLGEKLLYLLGTVIVWGALVWFLLQHPTDDSTSSFNLRRDSIYLAVILLGIGGSTIMVLALSMISMLIGDYSGSAAFVYGWMVFADRFSNGAINEIIQQFTPANTDEMAAYYREATVYTSFATTALGLFAMGVITSMDCYKKRKRRGRARDAIIPPGVGQIQSGTVGEVITKQASIQDGDSNFLSSDDEDMQRDIDMKRELDLTLSTQ